MISFALGLFLAITLDKRAALPRVYRSLLILPYAIPGFLSLLVWQGLLNDDFGVVNNAAARRHPVALRSVVGEGLGDPRQRLADLAVLLPDLARSAPVDPERADGSGAGGRRRARWQVFRKVTLPLLLIVVAPLMIASFAFNFNNFNNIYLLTGGGRQSNDQSVAARRTS